MNLFAVHDDPKRAARALCDKHVVRMTLETAQILCTVARSLGWEAPYRPTHARHPCVLWAGASHANWRWTLEHGLALAEEFERRYGKVHASREVLHWIRDNQAGPLPDGTKRQPFPQAMPDEYRCADSVQAYRRFYNGAKARFATWRAPSRPPAWFSPEASKPPLPARATTAVRRAPATPARRDGARGRGARPARG